MAQPKFYWDPSIAPSGLAVYEGEMFPEWRGDLLVGALKFRLLSRLDVENGEIVGEERLFADAFGRIRDVRVAPDGAIWFATDNARGGLFRVFRAVNGRVLDAFATVPAMLTQRLRQREGAPWRRLRT